MSRWTNHKTCALVLTCLAATLLPPATATNANPPPQPSGPLGASYEQVLLVVDFNRQGLNDTALFVKDRLTALYVSLTDLKRWRLRIPTVPVISVQGESYVPLAALPGVVAKLNDATQTLDIQVSPEAFLSTSANAYADKHLAPTPPSPGMFFNYDVFAERSNGATTRSGLFELGAFNALGVATANFALQNAPGQTSTVRLDTTFTIDRPEQRASVRLGDAISRPAGIWGRAVRFGGIQYATNFATQPGLITLPLQSFAGQAALPSTVDLYVNNVFTSSKELPPGPFSIANLPLVTGQGNVQMVVRDLLGREQVINQPFYTSTSLLRPGLQDFSVELGALRENFAIQSNDYGARFAAATYRRGFSDTTTGEVHAEIAEGGQSTMGFGATALFPALGTFNVAVAGSRSDAGAGHLWALGFDRQTAIFNFGARTQRNSDNFRQLGSDPAFPTPRHLTSANVGITANQYGSVGLAYIRQDASDNSRSEVASISYNLPLRRWGNLGITAFKTLSGESNRSIFINWTIPLDNNLTANLSHAKYGSGSDQSLLQVQRNLPSGEGYGYRLQAADNGPQQASLLLQNNIGTYALEAASFEGQSSARVGASGGVALLGGSAFLSRRITDSFGLVQVPGMEKIRVYVDNQPAGVTDAKGNALIPRLRPYDNNPVSIEQSDLGMDAEIGSLTMNPVPYYRSGVVIRFPIKRCAGALLRLISKDGQPMPAGAVVELEGQATQFPVAMDGQVYLTGLGRINRLHASWQSKYCTVSVPFEDSVDPLPNLGTLVCEEEHP